MLFMVVLSSYSYIVIRMPCNGSQSLLLILFTFHNVMLFLFYMIIKIPSIFQFQKNGSLVHVCLYSHDICESKYE